MEEKIKLKDIVGFNWIKFKEKIVLQVHGPLQAVGPILRSAAFSLLYTQ